MNWLFFLLQKQKELWVEKDGVKWKNFFVRLGDKGDGFTRLSHKYREPMKICLEPRDRKEAYLGDI